MTYQIDFTKEDPQMGFVNGRLRIKEKLVFFKTKNHDYAQAMMGKLQAGGAIITSGRNWIRINIFGEQDFVKLGGDEFNPKEKTPQELEDILVDFFRVNYVKAGFELEEKKLE